MTSTHDLPTVAGWWGGKDIETRVELGLSENPAKEREQRNQDRKSLWQAFRKAKAAAGERLPDQTSRIADAAVKFVADSASDLALIPLEDVLALEQQPNLPGTIDEYSNWRRRYPVQSDVMLDAPEVRLRLAPLKRTSRP
jgi:4-alpha-glucanotransferase